MLSLRERNRVAAMRATQREALRLFHLEGFAAVTVDDIADAVGMAPSTIYRHFGTKENLVLWDEHDRAIDVAFANKLGRQNPLDAIRDALVETMAPLYEEEADFQLDRVGYIFDTPQLHAAAIEGDYEHRDELTTALRSSLSRENKHAAPIISGAALMALDAALEQWQKSRGKLALANCITDAFATLGRLASID